MVETPRGKASITATLTDGQITELDLTTPSSAHVSLVERVAVGRELSDALVGVASLDLSPWEFDQ
jgi:Ni,Fe-hydrogenase III large subunit